MEISHRLFLFMCLFFVHAFSKVSTYVKFEGGATQTCVEKIGYFFPLLMPYSDMMNPFLCSSEFGTPTYLRSNEILPDN